MLNGGAGAVDAAALDSILNVIQDDPDVQWIEPDVNVAPEQPSGSAFSNGTQRTPWGLDRIGAQAGVDASNVDLYILDSGVAHEDLNLASCHDATGDSLAVCDAAADPSGHGTGVASIAAARNDDAGSVGIAAGARVHAIKVLGGGEDTQLSSVIQAVEHVTAQKLANPDTPIVANISFGMEIGTAAYNALDEAIQHSIEAGVVYTIAAGNEGIDATDISPAHVTEAITVGAYDRDNRFADFSNYGPVVDVLAPGVDLEVLTPDNPSLLAWDSGTSVAAPHVAGAAVRLLAKDPAMTPLEVYHTLMESAVPLVTDVPDHTTNKSVFVGTRQAFEDANHNGVYDANQDVLIDNAALQDGQYATNGSNSLVIPAAVGPIVTQNQIELRTNGNLTIRTSLEGTSSVRLLAGGYVDITDVSLASSNDQVLIEAGAGVNADAATLTAQKEVFIRGEGRMYFPEATLRSEAGRIEFDLARSNSVLTLNDAALLARRDVIINSEANVSLAHATVQAAEERASVRTTAKAVLSHATVETGKEVIVETGADIAAEHATLTSANAVVHLLSTSGTAHIALQNAALTTPSVIEVEASGTDGLLSVDGAAFSDNDDTVRLTPRCLPVNGLPAAGQVADACGS